VGSDADILGGRDLFVGSRDLVERHAEPFGEKVDGAAPAELQRAAGEQERRIVHVLAETHRFEEHLRLIIRRIVDDLDDAHLLPVAAEAGEREREQVVAEPGIDARGEKGGAPLLASRF
jgi:hypothetical protein